MPRVIRDEIHHDIELSDEAVALIDTREFQRLRHLRQLGTCSYVFPGADHTRFAHSLGAHHLATRLTTMLTRRHPGRLDPTDVRLTGLAALLHDIGHPPFSHMLESPDVYATWATHERWGARILQDSSTQIGAVLTERLSPEERTRLFAILAGTAQPMWMRQVVSSQMDVDRFDYILRDAQNTGTDLGVFDLDRCLAAIVLDDGGGLVIERKSLQAFESYLVSRYHLYHHVYYHKVGILTQAYYVRALRRARALAEAGELALSAPMASMLLDRALTPAAYARLTDPHVLAALDAWAQGEDRLLAATCERLLTRRGFHKRVAVEGLTEVAASVIRPELEALVAARGFDPAEDVIIERVAKEGYLPYRAGGIRLEDGADLAEASPLVASIADVRQTVQVFVPAGVRVEATDVARDLLAA